MDAIIVDHLGQYKAEKQLLNPYAANQRPKGQLNDILRRVGRRHVESGVRVGSQILPLFQCFNTVKRSTDVYYWEPRLTKKFFGQPMEWNSGKAENISGVDRLPHSLW